MIRDSQDSPPLVSPLTYNQQGIWLHQQQAPHSVVYNTSMALRIFSEMNPTALRRTFQTILDRHDALRTVVYPQQGKPVQEILPEPSVALTHIDATGWGEARLRAEVMQTHRRPYHLALGPLFRVHVFTQSSERHVLLMEAHHLIIDGASWLNILNEIRHLYPAFCMDSMPNLPAVENQYCDFAMYERDMVERQGEKLSAFWQTQLDDIPLQLDLPTDNQRPTLQQFRGSSEFFTLSPELTTALNALAKTEKVTLYVLLLASFQALLHRYSKQERFVVGAPVLNRPSQAFASTVGNCINLLPLSADFSENPTVKEALRQVWKTLISGLRNQVYPFSRLVQDLNLPHNPSRSPVIQTLFSFPQAPVELAPFLLSVPGDENPLAPLDWGGLSIAPFGLPQQDGGYDLGLEMVQGSDRLVGVLKYNTDLFQAATIQRMATHFRTLLEAMIANPDQPLAHLPILSKTEHHQMAHEWNNTEVNFGASQTIHAMFEHQVASTPDAVALVFEEVELSYAQLNARANRLAHYLTSLGAGNAREEETTLVAVVMERSVEMVVSLLAVLKSGGAYVPIDPTYPSERIRYMLSDCAAPILLTQSHLSLPRVTGRTKVVAVDQVRSELADQSTANPSTPTSPADLAYVIYTSGSTGQPKGVLIEHGGAFNVAAAQGKVLPALTTGSRLLHLASLGFDAATAEIMMALMHGVTLVVAPPHHERMGAALTELLSNQNITHVTLVPSVLQTLPDVKLPDLKVLITAGEACSDNLVARWAGDRAFFNFYGPTESPIWTTYAALKPGQTAHIGQPIPNRRVYILDDHEALVPLGVAGELYIGGEQLARGYLNRPELTAERFIEHPQFGRLYKTGDLCRWRLDSEGTPNIEFMGRMDFQVKMSGVRIELGEIESVLRVHEKVRDAVVLAREDQPGNQRLVAYIVGEGDEDTLLQHLAPYLPAHMIPSTFVMLEAMPLSPNGKLDRRALPAPTYADAQTTFAAPRNDVEVTLAHAFAHALRVSRVGIHDHFFRMGGDSILSIQVVSRAAEAGCTLGVNDVFRYPTVAQLATVVRTDAPASSPAVRASQEVQTGDAPLLPIQRWWLDANQPEMHHFNQYFFLTVKQPIDRARLEDAICTLISHHDALRFQYRFDASGWHQHYLAPGDHVPLIVVDLQPIPSEHRRAKMEAVTAQAQTSLNPLAGDLVRVVYFSASDSRSGEADRLLFVIHHLAVDGVSWRIILDDLATLLDGRPLPPKTSSYRDWAQTLKWETEKGYFDSTLSHWLTGVPEAQMPLDEPHALNTMGTSHQLRLTLSHVQTEHLLRSLPDRHDITLDAVVLTALTETFTAWSGQTSLRIQFESHGRQALFGTINLNRTVGWFTSSYPLSIPRVDGSALKRIRYTQDHLRRIKDGGLGFGALHHFHPDTDKHEQVASLPTAPVVYNYLGQIDSIENPYFSIPPESTGLSCSPHTHRDALLDSHAMVIHGQLQINWTISPQLRRETAESLRDAFSQHLHELIAQALGDHHHIAIPSDFVDADLSLEQLEALLDDLGMHMGNATDIESIYQLSPMQSGMWFHSQLAPSHGTYIEHNLFQVDDPRFDVTRFIQAIQGVIDAHDSLRAAFWSHRDNEAVQVIYKRAHLPVMKLDWRELAGDDLAQRLDKLLEQDRLTDFDVSQAPLLRLAVIERAHNIYDLLLTFHHILMDRWSVDLFWSEVHRAYAGQTLEPATPYQSYIHYLRQQPEDVSFWQAYLRGFSAPTPLPGMAPSMSSHTPGKPDSITKVFSQEASGQLTAFAREQGLPLNTIFQAAWAVLLARYARESDVVFGMVTSGRTASMQGIESILGLLINTLPFRVQLDSELTGSDLLQQVAQTQLDLQLREHTPLINVQHWSDMPAGVGLFDGLLLFQNTPEMHKEGAVEVDDDQLRLQPKWVNPGDTGYPLVALVSPGNAGEAASLVILYDTTRYKVGTVECLLTHWQQLVMGIVTHTDQPVLQIPMLTDDEYQQVVYQWNQTAVDFGAPQTIHALFEQQVECTPEALALVFKESRLTYAELNHRANQLAHHLIGLGVEPDTLVAVAMERSLEMVVSLLAVLKAGGAYIPIDPTYPTERIRYMLTDSAARIVLTQSHWDLDVDLDDDPKHVIAVDSVWAQLSPQATSNPQTQTTPEHLAYVIYTSGSTGRPKGVMIPHRHLFNLVLDNIKRFDLSPTARVMHAPTFGFDVGVGDLFMTLCSGAKLYLPPPGSLVGQALGNQLQQAQATHVSLTPAALSTLPIEAYPHLKTMIVAGEALPDTLTQTWLQFAAVWNAYGPTENTIYTTATRCQIGEKVHIGKPTSNVTTLILDDALHPIPVGVVGELYIGGEQLARGYLNRRDLTAERFIEHPTFGRLYKTGDLCHWLPDGNIEYLGRTDFQVKIRGYRIELGEIESALRAQDGIREAVVLAREEQSGDKRLVAYLVDDGDPDLDINQLRELLLQFLPTYMIPSAFIMLEEMPLNPNGKLDRQALPAPDFVDVQTDFVPPRNAVEQQLAEIWRDVLSIEQVGIHDNFLALGGHSLLATRVASHIRTQFKLDIPIKTIFETTNFAELAKILELSTGYQAENVVFSEQDEEF